MNRMHCKFVPATAILILSGSMATGWAQEMAVRSFDSTGQLTFNRIPTGQAYRVESATSLTGAWTRLTNAVTIDGIPTTMDCIPGKGGIATGAVPMQASSMFVRAVAETNDMALIPAGAFVMGATTNMGHEAGIGETPQHTVYVSAFYMERYEVTMEKWNNVSAWASTNGYTIPLVGTNSSSALFAKGPTHPVLNVSQMDCTNWCNARSAMEGLTPCYSGGDCNWSANGYRLPTEAEWEKAARGGVSGHRFPWTDTDTINNRRANYTPNTSKDYDTSGTNTWVPGYILGGDAPYTCPVGSFAPNGYGLYDMVGNAQEWCWDIYSDTYYQTSPTNDPRGPPRSPLADCVVRNGCWSQGPGFVRTSYRFLDSPGTRDRRRGFRCARSVVPPGP